MDGALGISLVTGAVGEADSGVGDEEGEAVFEDQVGVGQEPAGETLGEEAGDIFP